MAAVLFAGLSSLRAENILVSFKFASKTLADREVPQNLTRIEDALTNRIQAMLQQDLPPYWQFSAGEGRDTDYRLQIFFRRASAWDLVMRFVPPAGTGAAPSEWRGKLIDFGDAIPIGDEWVEFVAKQFDTTIVEPSHSQVVDALKLVPLGRRIERRTNSLPDAVVPSQPGAMNLINGEFLLDFGSDQGPVNFCAFGVGKKILLSSNVSGIRVATTGATLALKNTPERELSAITRLNLASRSFFCNSSGG
jgi:hypothetical protein